MKPTFSFSTKALLTIALLLAALAIRARAQSALDGFDPHANGAIQIVVVQPDGKILLGGDFTTLAPNGAAPVTRNRIARLNHDGTLDTAFNPNANGMVNAIAVQSDGKILAGGAFGTIGGATRNAIARLDPVTGLADSFNPNANGEVFAIAVQADGRILVGGDFNGANSIGGQTRNRIARLDSMTGAADSFDPNAQSTVRAIVIQPDGKILVGGAFNGANSIAGQLRQRIARLDPTTGLADSFDPGATGLVRTMALQADGKVLVGGAFNGANSIGGALRNRIARLDPVTGAADSFDPNANVGNVYSIAVQPDGKILAGGTFTNIGGQTRNRIARLNNTTGAADSFDPNSTATGVFTIAVQSDGKVLVGGSFTALTPNGGPGLTRFNIARLETDGRLDRTLGNLAFTANFDPYIAATLVQRDGKILLGGDFNSLLGVTRHAGARLNNDGTLDPAFDPNFEGGDIGGVRTYTAVRQADGKILMGGVFSAVGGQTRVSLARLDPTTGQPDSFDANGTLSSITSVAVQADGKIVVAGYFTTIGGQTRNRIARLDPVTGLADGFNPNADGPVFTLAIQPDGKILAGGSFTNIGGQPRNRLARIDPGTGLADSFDPNANGTVSTIALQPDGKILIGGSFTTVTGQPRNRIARLGPGGPDSFDPNASDSVYSIALQADGKILVGGDFTSIGGQTRARIARLTATTGAADSFNPAADAEVYSVQLQADGKVLLGGAFTSAGGSSVNSFARLSNDTSAQQELVVTRTAVTWIRGGSSPQLERVQFEDSSDGVNFNFLGNGVADGSNWTLTGLNLSTQQNIYIRARGTYRGGEFNASESQVESIRHAVLPATLQLIAAVSRKTHGGAGDFDIPLSLSGEPGVECRSSSGAHTLVFSFSNNVVSGNASVTAGVGSVSGSPTFIGNTMTVTLTGVADVQKITVTLSNVTDSVGQTLPATAVSMNVLAGDTNGNKSVSATDVGQTKSQSGATVTSANFRQDVAPNGSITATDIGLVKSRSGQFLP